MEDILDRDVQDRSQLVSKISARGGMDEFLGGSQQRAETGKPNPCLRPQSVIVKAGDLAQSVVSAVNFRR
jgi:hypothetical protein